jgi:xylulokinase
VAQPGGRHARPVRQVDASAVEAIGLTHQRETFVCLSENDEPLRPAILWMDARAVEQVAEHGSEEMHRTSGKPLTLRLPSTSCCGWANTSQRCSSAPVVWSTCTPVMGELGADAAQAFGLTEGLPVVGGAGDGQSAGLGANITEPGRAYLNLGTAVVGGTYSQDYHWGRAFRTLGGPIPESYTLETLIQGGTTARVTCFVPSSRASRSNNGYSWKV